MPATANPWLAVSNKTASSKPQKGGGGKDKDKEKKEKAAAQAQQKADRDRRKFLERAVGVVLEKVPELVVSMSAQLTNPVVGRMTAAFTAPPTSTLAKLRAMLKAAKILKKSGFKESDDTTILADMSKNESRQIRHSSLHDVHADVLSDVHVDVRPYVQSHTQ